MKKILFLIIMAAIHIQALGQSAYCLPTTVGSTSGADYVNICQSNATKKISWTNIISSLSLGSGTVTTFSAGTLAPLFTTSVSNATTTPALTFAQVSQAQNLVFASPNGSAGNPTFRAIVAGDLPSLSGTYVPIARTLTINGTLFDLSANRSWTVGDALVANPLSQFASTTSAQLRGVLSDESGTGVFLTANGSAASLTSFPTFNQNTTGSAATLTTTRTLWGQSFDGSANVTGSLTAVGDITGGASSMIIQAGTGTSRTLTFKTTTGLNVAVTALTLAADQSATFANTVNATTFVGALTGNATTATAWISARKLSITGDLIYDSPLFDGSGNVTAAGTLATVNSNVGSFGSATQVGTFTVNGKGLITAASNVTITATAASITGGAALTKVDDTNVTLTLGGAPTTALLSASSISVGWAGTLADSRLSTTAVTAASYGSATASPTYTVSATGRLTAASNITITPAVGSITGFGTGIATALAINVGTSGSLLVNGGVLGTPSSGVLTNATGLPISTGLTGWTANRVYYVDNSGVLTGLALGAANTVLTGNGTTSAPTFAAPAQVSNSINVYTLLGGAIKAEPIAGTVSNLSAAIILTNTSMKLVAVYLPQAATLTGVKWFQSLAGVYTANNYNGVGLYSYSAGTLTLVASSTNDGTIWQTTGSTWGSKAFSSTYAAAAGVYFIAALYCRSAETTAPNIFGNPNGGAAAIQTVDFTNSAKISGIIAAQTTFPATQAMSGVTAVATNPYFGVY